MRILLTGSSGFIGSHLLEKLLNLEHPEKEKDIRKVVGLSRRSKYYPWDIDLDGPTFQRINCDLTNEQAVASTMLRLKPDVVFHLAGDPLIKNWGPAASLANYTATHHLLAYAPKGCRFVFASSCAVYGDQKFPYQVFNENDTLRPTSAYGAAKAGSEHLVNAFTAAGLVSGVNLRYAATVGSGATHGLVYDIVKKLLSPAEKLELIGDHPGSRKPYTHVSDVVRGTLQIGFRPAVAGSLNLCLGDTLSVAEVAYRVMDAVGIKKDIFWLGGDANWPGDNKVVHVDSECTHLLGWNPECPTSRTAVERAAKELFSEIQNKKVAA